MMTIVLGSVDRCSCVRCVLVCTASVSPCREWPKFTAGGYRQLEVLSIKAKPGAPGPGPRGPEWSGMITGRARRARAEESLP